jgi:hypothetical protein
MNKYVLVVIVFVASYFLIFKDSYPNAVEFNGHTLSSKEDNNNSRNKDLDIFSYSDKSNHHVLMFAITNDAAITLSDLSKQYLGRFEYQGYSFSKSGTNFIGRKSDEIIYMAESPNINALIVYIEKGASQSPRHPSDAAGLFNELENFLL